jgi:hypothetical protein
VNDQVLDTFVCVHQRDVGYLLELVLRAYEVNFRPKNRLILITNDLPYLRAFCERTGVARGAVLTSDSDWLSSKEQQLSGWYRQQIIKLRAYEFCETPNFCNLGADTVLLQPIEASDLIDNGFPILYYTSHPLPDLHARFERERIAQIGRILSVEPTNAEPYVDFINDLFTFNGEALRSLNGYLEQLYGEEPYYTLLSGLDGSTVRNQFGEWTLYSVYLLDVLKRQVTLRNTKTGFLHQVHSKLMLRTYRFNTKVAHFVGKDFDIGYIKQQIARRNPELGKYL